MSLRLDPFSSCFLDLTLGEGAVDGRVALSACLVFPDTVAKSPTVSWQTAKACSAPRRGQLLMRTLMQLHRGGRGPGEPGLGARPQLQLQLVSIWRLLNPSQQVHDTWAEGLRDGGRPGPVFSVDCSSRGAWALRVQMRPGCPPDCRHPRPGRVGLGHRRQS